MDAQTWAALNADVALVLVLVPYTLTAEDNASPDAPHLHFAVFVLGPERRWWEGQAINPYPLLRGEGKNRTP